MTIDSVDFHLLARPTRTDDPVARDRVATFGKGESYPRGQAANRNVALAPFGGIGERLSTARHKRLHHVAILDLGGADRVIEIVVLFHIEPLERLLERLLANPCRHPAGDLVEQFLADFGHLGAFLQSHRTADRGARLAGDDIAEPGQLRLGAGALDDFHHIPVGERGPQRHVPAVDLGAHRLRAQIRVDGKREIDRGRALGQLEQPALGGEGENTILIDRHPRVLEQLLGIMAGIDDLDQVAQPADLAVGAVALLVGPVRGEAEFVQPVHLAGADLDLHAHRVFVHQRGVQ